MQRETLAPIHVSSSSDTETRPRVTAIIVTYQQERYVGECLRSVLDQTSPPDQVVIADDGSTDGTLEAIRTIHDKRVEIVALPHRGLTALADTYNAALARSRGELVSTIEGDDRWRPHKLALHIDAFTDHSIVVAHGPYAVIGARGTLLRSRVDPPLRLRAGCYDALPANLLMSYVMPVTATIRRSALEAIGGFHQLGDRPHIDHPTYLRLAEHGSFHYTTQVIAEWRKHGASGTSRIVAEDIDRGPALQRELARAVRARTGRNDLPSDVAIDRAWESAHGRQLWNAARLLLRSRRYREASEVLAKARGHRYPLGLRLRLLLVRIAAHAHVDVDAVATIRRRSPFDELE